MKFPLPAILTRWTANMPAIFGNTFPRRTSHCHGSGQFRLLAERVDGTPEGCSITLAASSRRQLVPPDQRQTIRKDGTQSHWPKSLVGYGSRVARRHGLPGTASANASGG